jgi:multidrug efflux pump subunit AcrA (membrane-fusion protein)
MLKRKINPKFFLGALALMVIVVTAGCAVAGAAKTSGTPGKGAIETGAVSTINIVDNVEATGSVQAEQAALLTWKTSGIVEKVNVENGDPVKTGDVLAALQLTSVPANVLSAQADLINAQKALDDLTPTTLAISKAEQKIAAAQDDLKKKQDIVDNMGTPARKADLDQANATKLLTKITLDNAWDRYKRFKNRPDSNATKAMLYNRWAEAQQKYDAAVRRYNNLSGQGVDPTDQALAKANLELAKSTLADAQKNLADLQAGANAQDVAAAKARITAAQATLDTLRITAPFDGEILINYVQPGDVVTAGQNAFALANRSQLHVITMIDESDIHNVQVGNKAELILDAAPGKTFTGSVAYIDPLGQTVSGNVKYEVRIDLDPIDVPLLLGATADVTIQTGQPRQALTAPVRAIQSDSQGEFVNVVQPDGVLKRVDITTGPLKGDQVIILSGDLLASDKIELPSGNSNMFQQMQNGGG